MTTTDTRPTQWATERARARHEDATDLANWGVPFHEAAQRLQLTTEALRRWLQKNDQALLTQLIDNAARRGLTAEGTLRHVQHTGWR